ncbi:hypothetical protein JL720_12652 [Aureococcus anophagefferens]|nr:hypothetical protein JL720_12652 [Aureococcus anophagefferens]
MELDLGASGAESAPATNSDAVAAPAVLADVAAPADVAYDPLLEAVVAKKFPGYGKEPWIGEVIEGPDEKDRYCCLWEKDQSTTWHSRKVIEKIILRAAPEFGAPAASALEVVSRRAAAAAAVRAGAAAATRAAAAVRAGAGAAAGAEAEEAAAAAEAQAPPPPPPAGAFAVGATKRPPPACAPPPPDDGADVCCVCGGPTVDAGRAHARRVLICDGDAPRGALACAGIDARPGFEWRCDRCAPAVPAAPRNRDEAAALAAARRAPAARGASAAGRAAPLASSSSDSDGDEECKFEAYESIYAEEDATPPGVAEAHALRAVVDNLRQEFYGVVSAGQNVPGPGRKASGVSLRSRPSEDRRSTRRERTRRRPGRSKHRPRRQVWVGERSWDQRGPFALSDRDAAEIYGKVVFWEGADADLSARAGGDFADLEVSAPEDWLRKPSSISLFPSGRCGATRAYLAAEISKRVEDRSTRVDALRSGDAALSASDSARLIVDKWLRFCDAAAERVDARRREVTAALRATLSRVRGARGDADDANDEAEVALAARPGRIPKRKRPQARGDGDDERPPAFLSKVFSMLLRYDDLAGDAGQHGAIPPPSSTCSGAGAATPSAARRPSTRRWGATARPSATRTRPLGAWLVLRSSPRGCYEINPPFTLNSDVVERHLRTPRRRGARRAALMFVMVHAATRATRDGATLALPADRAPLRER